jgi:hypothetical protein
VHGVAFDAERVEAVADGVTERMGATAIAKQLGIGRASVYRALT